MTRITVLLVLLTVFPLAGLAQDDDDAEFLYLKATYLAKTGQRQRAAIVRKELLRLYPRSKHAAETLWHLAAGRLPYRATPKQSQPVIALLRRLHQQYPGTKWAKKAMERAGNLGRWRFSQLATNRRPKERLHISGRRRGPDSTFTLYRASPRHFRDTPQNLYVTWFWPKNLDALKFSRVLRRLFEKRVSAPQPAASGLAIGPLLEQGVYVFEENIDGFTMRRKIEVRDFAVFCRLIGTRLMVLTHDRWTGDPLGDSVVKIQQGKKIQPKELKTGKDGVALFDGIRQDCRVSVTRGQDTQQILIEPEKTDDDKEQRVHIATDRPIYRPSQQVHYKAIHRQLAKASLQFRAGTPVVVEIHGPKDQVLLRRSQRWSRFGSVAGSYRLGAEPPLGHYTVLVRVPRPRQMRNVFAEPDDLDRFWQHEFRVVAYRKPDIQVGVDITPPGPDNAFKGQVKAVYYSGGKVANANVTWELRRSYRWGDDSSGPDLPFEDPLGWFYDRERRGSGRGMGEVIARGQGKTNPQGAFDISVAIKPSYWPVDYELEATVTDLSRLAGTGNARTKSGPLTVTTGVDRMFYREGERTVARVRVRTPDGRAQPGTPVKLFLLAVNKPQSDQTEYEPVQQFAGKTDATGLASFPMTLAQTGRLRLLARVGQSPTLRSAARSDFYVARKDGRAASRSSRPHQFRWAPPESNVEAPFSAMPDRVAYRQGETARLLVRTTDTPLNAWLLIEGRTIHRVRQVALPHAVNVLRIPLGHRFSSRLKLHLIAWHRGQPRSCGAMIYQVPSSSGLKVSIRTDQTEYKPGDKVRLEVRTTVEGRPAAAEVELGVVDRSVLSLVPEQVRDIRTFFHPLRGWEAESYTNCSWLDPDIWQHQYSGGVGAAGASFSEPAAPAPNVGAAPGSGALAGARTRRWFPDTLFWSGQLVTNEQGVARLTLETPDSLTRWRLLARGVTVASQFGQGEGEMRTRKGVVLRLSAPRFYTEGDSGTVSTVVHNRLPHKETFQVGLRVDGVDRPARKLVIPADGLARLDWQVRATRPGRLDLRAEALSRVESDAIEISLPVRRYGVLEQRKLAGRVAPNWRGQISLPPTAQGGQLELIVSSTPAEIIRQALPSLVGYPYGCVEQTMSRFLPAVVATSALKRVGRGKKNQLVRDLPGMISRGLDRLSYFQHEDGGWGWWKHDKSDYWMTTYVLFGLATTRRAKVTVQPELIERALGFLDRAKLSSPFELYARTLAGAKVNIFSARPRQKGLPTQQLMDLAHLVLAGRRDLAPKLRYEPPKKVDSQAIRCAALIVQALGSVNSDDGRIQPLLDWLMTQRQGGRWLSTLDTAYVIYALAGRVKAQASGEGHARLNGKPIALTGGRAVVPATGLRPGKNQFLLSAKRGFASARLTYYETRRIRKPHYEGVQIERRFEVKQVEDGEVSWRRLKSGAAVRSGDELRVVVRVRAPKGVRYAMIECALPAGTEPRRVFHEQSTWWGLWYARFEQRDDRVSVAAEWIDERWREFSFRLRPTLPGTYRVLPARAFAMYDPDQQGRTAAYEMRVID